MTTLDESAKERDKPEIVSELDVPIVDETPPDSNGYTAAATDVNLDNRIRLSEQKHMQRMDYDRFGAGKYLVFVCIFVMGAFALLDFFLSDTKGNSELMSNVFEVLKLVTMTALGYIFSSNRK